MLSNKTSSKELRTSAGVFFNLYQAGVSRSNEGGVDASYQASKHDILVSGEEVANEAVLGESVNNQEYLPFSASTPWSVGSGFASR